jgi:2-dehydropantoate 2-reductase
MRFLFYGGGVLGSLYAAKLSHAGEDVAVLARGRRLAELRSEGLVVEHATSRERIEVRVPAVDSLAPDDAYDWIAVTVRKDQVASVLPALARYRGPANVLFMVNNAEGYGAWADAVGAERLVVGFPGAGGCFDGPRVRYVLAPRALQPTTLGELHGRRTPRVQELAQRLRQAGLPAALCRNMDAWQRYHVAWVWPICAAVELAGGDPQRLVRTPELLALSARAVREGFRALRRLGFPVTPYHLHVWTSLPVRWHIALLARLVEHEAFEHGIVAHALAARDETAWLAEEFRRVVGRAGVPLGAVDELRTSALHARAARRAG